MSSSLPYRVPSSFPIPPPGSGLQTELIEDEATRNFLTAFLAAGGTFSPLVSLTQIETQGNCCIANDDIEEGTELFNIPRDILFNTTACPLGQICREFDASLRERGENDMSIDEIVQEPSTSKAKTWDELTGWTPLIVSLMWSTLHSSNATSSSSSSSSTSKRDALWSTYFSVMPTDFSHLPMFWSESDLKELRGTSIPERIGKEEADAEYHDVVQPYIRSRPGIFWQDGDKLSREQIEERLEQDYSLDKFHIQGSRILSRSFHVKRQGTQQAREGGMVDMDETHDTGSDLDSDDDDGDDEEEKEDTGDISMVPMADMLNASYDSENARLFYDPTSLSMRSVCAIKRGDQILNTFNDPPGADLLRRYGYVDVVNGADEVELNVKNLVEGVLSLQGKDTSEATSPVREGLMKRVEHCIAYGGFDESYVLAYIFPPTPSNPSPQPSIPDLTQDEIMSLLEEGRCNFFEDEELLSICKALLLEEEEWKIKYESKKKVPRGKMSTDVAQLLVASCESRQDEYPSDHHASSEGKEEEAGSISLNARNARMVRQGEKNVLRENKDFLQRWIEVEKERKEEVKESKGSQGKKTKRKEEESNGRWEEKAKKRTKK